MPPNGFKSIALHERDYAKLERIRDAENLLSFSETLRMLMRDWERTRKPEIPLQATSALQGLSSIVKRTGLYYEVPIALQDGSQQLIRVALVREEEQQVTP